MKSKLTALGVGIAKKWGSVEPGWMIGDFMKRLLTPVNLAAIGPVFVTFACVVGAAGLGVLASAAALLWMMWFEYRDLVRAYDELREAERIREQQMAEKFPPMSEWKPGDVYEGRVRFVVQRGNPMPMEIDDFDPDLIMDCEFCGQMHAAGECEK